MYNICMYNKELLEPVRKALIALKEGTLEDYGAQKESYYSTIMARKAEVLIHCIDEASFNIIEQNKDSYIRESDKFFVGYDPDHGEFKFKIEIKYESLWSSDYGDYINKWSINGISYEDCSILPEEVIDWSMSRIYEYEEDINELSFDEDYEYDELLEEKKVERKRFTRDSNALNSIINYLNMGECSIPWKKELKDTGDITCRLFWSFAYNAKCEFEAAAGYPFLEELECYV
jgi:hypothetical protein